MTLQWQCLISAGERGGQASAESRVADSSSTWYQDHRSNCVCRDEDERPGDWVIPDCILDGLSRLLDAEPLPAQDHYDDDCCHGQTSDRDCAL